MTQIDVREQLAIYFNPEVVNKLLGSLDGDKNAALFVEEAKQTNISS